MSGNMTLVVSSLHARGRRSYGTPEQRSRALLVGRHNRRVSEEVKMKENPAHHYPKQLRGLRTSPRSSVDEEPPEKKDPTKTYTLGSQDLRWDEQRAKWLKDTNPNCPNFLQPNKPRVRLVTGSSPRPVKIRVALAEGESSRGGGWSKQRPAEAAERNGGHGRGLSKSATVGVKQLTRFQPQNQDTSCGTRLTAAYASAATRSGQPSRIRPKS
ncbi:hypothetical protein Cgig2_033827 [Carnegiea gigantea]|uniref:Uncharacterized protein n=1 Tax=Carnegiea gigantea TaxID=171969 RepID=A0A9Q1JTH6_9CARY|nr:hypothetical protein Cgig2_033827 [Carnegiea gigantea]